MSIDTRMNYASMERMQKAFEQAARTIEDTERKMQQIERQMEGGALQGEAGDAFREALRGKLSPRLKVLRDKMAELAKDINGAVVAKRDGVSTAQSRFK
jgi:uncharacterized protein YukE